MRKRIAIVSIVLTLVLYGGHVWAHGPVQFVTLTPSPV